MHAAGRSTLARGRIVAAFGIAATVVASLATGGGSPVRAATAPVPGSYHALVPFRILDTRSHVGTCVPGCSTVGPNGRLDVNVTGVDGVPAGATAAVINLTATNASTASFLTLWPAGGAQPLASNVNFGAGQSAANLAEVGLGTGGQVSVYNLTGTVDVVMDIEGYVAPDSGSTNGDLFNPLQPARLLDTRNGTGAPSTAPMTTNGVLHLQVSGRGGVPATGAGAVVLNLTEADDTGPGYLTAWPAGASRPNASTVNFAAGETRPNRVVVGLGTGGVVDIYNLSGNVDVLADVSGWFATPGGSGGQFTALSPSRIVDSRNATGGQLWPWGPHGDFPVQVAGRGGVPAMGGASGPSAVVANVTVTDTTFSSYLSAWPHGAPQPVASDLNYTAGETIANLVVVPLSSTGQVDLFNLQGCADVVVDVVGYYTGPMPAAANAPAPGADPCAPPESAGWLRYVDYYRATAGEPAVTEDTSMSQGDANHAHYTVANGILCHCEDPSLPYYSASGNAAAQASDIIAGSNPGTFNNIDTWMTGPFHAAGIIDPSLTTSGYGEYTDLNSTSGFVNAAALNVITGRNSSYADPWPSTIEWPGNGMTVPLSFFSNNESPSPTAACGSSYTTTSVGLPIDLMVGPQTSLTVQSSSLTYNGSALPFCEVDQNQAGLDSTARSLLSSRGQVVLIPQNQLQREHAYTASVTVQVHYDNGQTTTSTYAWSFFVAYSRDGF
jgi:hypothetical protein